jgi:twitching motility protein PilT
MPQIDDILSHMKDIDASDVHLATGSPVTYRIYNDLVRANERILSKRDVELLIYEFLQDEQIKVFEQTSDLDTSYTYPGFARFRVNVFRDQRGPGAVFRIIPEQPPTLAKLQFPAVVARLAENPRGLTLVTGPTNSGKTTTLAAMINHLNETQSKHIITLEDPLEFVHENKECLITQRQVGVHTRSFAAALRACLREDPNVIMVGEMRDLETIHLALTAAELGLSVLGTLHTRSAAQTVTRLIDAFPYEQQPQIRVMLSESLRGIISQQLVRRADGNGRVAVLEILTSTPAIAHMIRENKTQQINTAIQTGRRDGMQLMAQHLQQLIEAGVVSPDAAAGMDNPKSLVADEQLKPELVS